MEKKFNKANVSDLIQDEINRLQRTFCFDADKGTSQLTNVSEHVKIAYGRFVALKDLYEDIFGNDKNFYLIP